MFVELYITAQSGPAVLIILSFSCLVSPMGDQYWCRAHVCRYQVAHNREIRPLRGNNYQVVVLVLPEGYCINRKNCCREKRVIDTHNLPLQCFCKPLCSALCSSFRFVVVVLSCCRVVGLSRHSLGGRFLFQPRNSYVSVSFVSVCACVCYVCVCVGVGLWVLLFLAYSLNPKKKTLHGGQSRSWPAEQGKENCVCVYCT